MGEYAEIVVKIPRCYLTHPQDYSCLAECVRRGVLLPIGHGDLIDVNDLLDRIGLEDNNSNREDNVGEIITLEDIDRLDVIVKADKVENGIERNLCDSCTNRGCIFQSGIVRNHCSYYKAESEEKKIMAAYDIAVTMNLSNFISEAREAAQAMNELADNLERISNKYSSENEEPDEMGIGRCKDCKWWKDSDGIYRRGIGAESQCLINHREVFEGNGYCFMYEPKMQAESEK